MKKVYVSHCKQFDFEKELYAPLKKLKKIELILPHEKSNNSSNSKEKIRNCDFFIAEVSMPSIPTGIEIGWADAFEKPIIFLIKKGAKISSSLKFVSEKIIEYETIEGILPELEKILH